MLASTFAPIIGGIIGTMYGWASIFYVLGAVAVTLLIIMIFYGKETLPVEKRRKGFSLGLVDEYMAHDLLIQGAAGDVKKIALERSKVEYC